MTEPKKTLPVLAAWVLLLCPFASTAQTLPGDLVAGFGSYPNFDAGVSYGALHAIRNGVVSEALDTYEASSQGPHDLINAIVFDQGGIVFDRWTTVVSLRDGSMEQKQFHRNISGFVRDRSSALYVSSGYGGPTLEKLASSGQSEWVVTLPFASDAWQLTMDLGADQCTLWYSGPGTAGIFRYDVCEKAARGAIAALPAKAIRILPDGGALVGVSSGIARLDSAGAVVAQVPYRLPPSAYVEFVSIALAADATTFWVGEGSRLGESLIYRVATSDLSVVLEEHSIPARYRALSSLAVYREWRAATSNPPRRRGVRRDSLPGSEACDLTR
jgi:hypothetical protein